MKKKLKKKKTNQKSIAVGLDLSTHYCNWKYIVGRGCTVFIIILIKKLKLCNKVLNNLGRRLANYLKDLHPSLKRANAFTGIDELTCRAGQVIFKILTGFKFQVSLVLSRYPNGYKLLVIFI